MALVPGSATMANASVKARDAMDLKIVMMRAMKPLMDVEPTVRNCLMEVLFATMVNASGILTDALDTKNVLMVAMRPLMDVDPTVRI